MCVGGCCWPPPSPDQIEAGRRDHRRPHLYSRSQPASRARHDFFDNKYESYTIISRWMMMICVTPTVVALLLNLLLLHLLSLALRQLLLRRRRLRLCWAFLGARFSRRWWPPTIPTTRCTLAMHRKWISRYDQRTTTAMLFVPKSTRATTTTVIHLTTYCHKWSLKCGMLGNYY